MAFKIARRAFVKLFGIGGFLLALIGGVLIGYSTLTSGGLSITSLIIRMLEALLALAAVAAGIMMYTGPKRIGGILAVFGGIILLILTGLALPAILVFAGGILGILGAAMKPGGSSGNSGPHPNIPIACGRWTSTPSIRFPNGIHR